MATLVIKDLDNDLAARLYIDAVQHGRSVEEEALCILRHALSRQPEEGLGSRISERFARVGGVELDLPGRHEMPRQRDV